MTATTTPPMMSPEFFDGGRGGWPYGDHCGG